METTLVPSSRLASGCFYGEDRVRLVDGGTRLIQDLQVGDRVWSLTSDGQECIEDEIIMIMHTGRHQTGESTSASCLPYCRRGCLSCSKVSHDDTGGWA